MLLTTKYFKVTLGSQEFMTNWRGQILIAGFGGQNMFSMSLSSGRSQVYNSPGLQTVSVLYQPISLNRAPLCLAPELPPRHLLPSHILRQSYS